MSDPRFARLATDPRFIRPSKASQKVVLDERFADLLSAGGSGDVAAGSTTRVDKYGRKVGKDKNVKDLKAFYRLEEEGGKGKGKQVDRARGEGLIESSDEEEEEDGSEQDSDEQDDDEDEEEEEIMLGTKQARKDAARRTRRASSEISIDLDEDALLATTSQNNAQVESSIPTMEGSTKRIAIVNLDWDNVRAIDLYKVFDSVLSPSASSLVEGTSLGSRKSKSRIGKGRVISAKIYPSEFGKQRMEREEKEGPPVEIFNKHKKSLPTNGTLTKASSSKKAARRKARDEDDFSDDDFLQEDRGDEYDEVALRRYQLERLRYYYAIVEFDTAAASQHAYDEIDGTEFEATANVLDLRYVPDDTTFDDTPTDTATASSVDMQAYKPVEFVTDALRNSKVKLTWDADDPARSKLVRGTHEGAASKGKGKSKSKEEAVDYSALLASDSEDDEEARKRVRSAFGFSAERGPDEDGDDDDDLDTYGLDDGDVDKEMEITFGPALSGNAVNGEEKDKEEETSLEAYQRKDRERRLAKKEKRKAEKKRLASGGGKNRVMHEDEEDSDPDEAFDANQMEAAGDDEDGRDAFFDVGSDEDNAEEEETERKLSKKATKQLEREAKDKEKASLSLLVGDDDENGSGDDGKHFDMQAILRAEKISSKPKKVLKKGKDRKKHTEAKQLLEREKDKFEVDTKDDRFKMLHESHEYALDPSNPRYMKTKNMEKLLSESRKRRNSDKPTESGNHSNSHAARSTPALDGQGLSSLVESIKRKSAGAAGQNGERDSKKAKKQKKA